MSDQDDISTECSRCAHSDDFDDDPNSCGPCLGQTPHCNFIPRTHEPVPCTTTINARVTETYTAIRDTGRKMRVIRLEIPYNDAPDSVFEHGQVALLKVTF
jgi:hypothetical protein